MTIETIESKLCQAIQARQQIIYTCTGDNHVPGEREGNPHIIYRTKNEHVMIHIWQTGGVSTDPGGPLPGWRSYHLSDIKLLRIGDQFDIEDTFNPDSKMYADTICSV